MSGRSKELTAREQQLKDALNTIMSGIVLLNSKGQVLFANNMAEEILSQKDGLSYHGGKIRLASACSQSEFDHLVSKCASVSEGTPCCSGSGLHVSRPSDRPFYRVVVAPLNRNSRNSKFDSFSTVIVFIYDTDQQHVPSGVLLQSMYHLTEAEVKVVHLFYQCYNVQKIAEEFGLKISTVRSHLYRVFEKTETKSQAELMKFLDRLPRAIPS